MKQIYKSLLSVIILLFLFFLSFYIQLNKDPSLLCDDDSCFTLLALESSNYNYCNFANNSKDCLISFSFEKNDSSICSLLLNFSSCYERHAILNRDILLCQYSDNLDKCVFSIAYYLKNSSICDFANDEILCYYSYAITIGELEICQKTEKYLEFCEDFFKNEN